MFTKKRIITMWVATFAMVLIAMPVAALSQQLERPYRVSDRQVEQIIRRIEQRTDLFRRHIDRALDRSLINGTAREDEINAYIQDFERMTNRLRNRFNNRRSVATDVQMILNSSLRINRFIEDNRLNRTVENDWTLLRRDLGRLAEVYNVAWNWSAGYDQNLAIQVPYRITDREVDNLLRRIDMRARKFKQSLDRALDESRFDATRREDEINRYIANFNNETENLRERFDDRKSVAADVEKVLGGAARIDEFMRRNLLNKRAAQNDWTQLRTSLDELARVYNVSWNWYTATPGTLALAGFYTGDALLTGTFRINTSRSDDPRAIANRITPGMSQINRERVENLIISRFAPAQVIAIERRGGAIVMETSRIPTVIRFQADGRAGGFQPFPDGASHYVRTEIKSDRLTLSTMGTRDGDFRITFTPVNNGQMLLVTRFIYSDLLRQPAIVQTYYDRVADRAQWGVYNNYNSSSFAPR